MDSDEIRNRVAVSPVRNFQYGGDHDAGRAHWHTFTSDPELKAVGDQILAKRKAEGRPDCDGMYQTWTALIADEANQ